MIEMELRPMSELPKGSQRFVCKCVPKCDTYLDIDIYGRFCKKSSLELAYDIFHKIKGINGTPRVGKRKHYREWTLTEVQYIKDWYSKGGFGHGDVKIIAEKLNREHSVTSSKIAHMRRNGEL